MFFYVCLRVALCIRPFLPSPSQAFPALPGKFFPGKPSQLPITQEFIPGNLFLGKAGRPLGKLGKLHHELAIHPALSSHPSPLASYPAYTINSPLCAMHLNACSDGGSEGLAKTFPAPLPSVPRLGRPSWERNPVWEGLESSGKKGLS